jgi:hypothetical protein
METYNQLQEARTLKSQIDLYEEQIKSFGRSSLNTLYDQIKSVCDKFNHPTFDVVVTYLTDSINITVGKRHNYNPCVYQVEYMHYGTIPTFKCNKVGVNQHMIDTGAFTIIKDVQREVEKVTETFYLDYLYGNSAEVATEKIRRNAKQKYDRIHEGLMNVYYVTLEDNLINKGKHVFNFTQDVQYKGRYIDNITEVTLTDISKTGLSGKLTLKDTEGNLYVHQKYAISQISNKFYWNIQQEVTGLINLENN